MAGRFEGHGHEPIARKIKPNYYTSKPEPLKWAGEVGGGAWVPVREAIIDPLEWWDWVRYRFAYYRRFPARVTDMDIRCGWNDVMRLPRTRGEGYDLVSRRPEGEKSLRSRFKHAWAVFTGKADALYWMGQ